MKGLLAIAACVALLWVGTACAAARSNVVIVTIMGAGLVRIEGHTYSDVHALGEKLAAIKQRKPPQDLEVVAPPGSTIEALLPAIDLLQKAGGPPKMGFLIEPRAQ